MPTKPLNSLPLRLLRLFRLPRIRPIDPNTEPMTRALKRHNLMLDVMASEHLVCLFRLRGSHEGIFVSDGDGDGFLDG